MKYTIGTIILSASATCLNAQVELSQKKWQPSNFTIRTGSETPFSNYEENEKGFKERSGATNETVDQTKAWSSYYGPTTSPNLFLGLDMEFRHFSSSREDYIPGLKARLGINYSHKTMEGIRNTERTTLGRDTLVSGSSEKEIYSEKRDTKINDVTFSTNELRIDGSVLFHTSKERSISFYAGSGIQLGGVISSTVRLQSRSWENTYYTIPENEIEIISSQGLINVNNEITYYNGASFEPTEEKTEKGKTYLTFGAYIPVGFNIQFTKKDTFLKHISLNSELRLGVNVAKNQRYLTANAMMGLRVNL